MPAPEGNKYAVGNDGGRPTKYKPEYAEQAEKLCKLGATDEDLADFFKVNKRSVERWRGEHEEFCRATKVGKGLADDLVERSLYERARGYICDDTHIAVHQGEVIVTPIKKHYPPDTAAAFIWLKNRKKDEWRDKQEVEHNVSDDLASLLDARRKLTVKPDESS